MKWFVNGKDCDGDHNVSVVNGGKLRKLYIFHSNLSNNGSKVLVFINDEIRRAKFYVGGNFTIIQYQFENVYLFHLLVGDLSNCIFHILCWCFSSRASG